MSKKSKISLVISGIITGIVNGFLGGGGGVIAVTALTACAGLSQKKSQATALAVIFPLAVVSAVVYLMRGNVDWTSTLWTSLGVTAGGVVGALLLNKLQGNVVKVLFAVVLLLGGLRMVW